MCFFITWEVEDKTVFILTFARLADEVEKAIVERDDNAGMGRVTLGFVLLELQQTVGIIDVVESEVFDIAET